MRTRQVENSAFGKVDSTARQHASTVAAAPTDHHGAAACSDFCQRKSIQKRLKTFVFNLTTYYRSIWSTCSVCMRVLCVRASLCVRVCVRICDLCFPVFGFHAHGDITRIRMRQQNCSSFSPLTKKSETKNV